MSLTNKKKRNEGTELTVVAGAGSPSLEIGQQAQTEDEIDLLDMAYMLLDKVHCIIVCFLAGAVIANACAFFLIAPTYSSTAKMYVVSASNDSVVDLTDLNIGTSLTADYEQLMLSYPVLDQVIEQLNLDMDSDKLAKMIDLTNPTDSRILNITATSTDPKQAQEIANTLMDVSIKYLPDTMSTTAPNVAQRAKIADKKVGPSYPKYTLLGALLGALIYCAWLVFVYLTDDTIRTPEDMEKYFGIVPLASVPDVDVEDKAEEHPEKKKRHREGKKA